MLRNQIRTTMAASSVSPTQTESLVSITDHWEVHYSRFFRHPTHFASSTATTTTAAANSSSSSSLSSTDDRSSLSSMQRIRSVGTWLSLSASSVANLYIFADHRSGGSVLAVLFGGRVMEEHFTSKLHFTWPQVSCVSGFPTRGSLVIFVTYRDRINEVQKFALRFSNIDDTSTFVKCLEDSLFMKKDSVQELSPISSQSQIVPHYRMDSLRMMDCRPTLMPGAISMDTSEILELPPIHTAQTQTPQGMEVNQLASFHDNFMTGLNHGADLTAINSVNGLNYETNSPPFPPRFTSMVTNCYSQTEQVPPNLSDESDIKAQIEKYMQDASFLDMLNKVEQVINELGSGPILQVTGA